MGDIVEYKKEIEDYLSTSEELLEFFLEDMWNILTPKHGELYGEPGNVYAYNLLLDAYIEVLSEENDFGSSIRDDLMNITKFISKVYKSAEREYENIYNSDTGINVFRVLAFNIEIERFKNGALPLEPIFNDDGDIVRYKYVSALSIFNDHYNEIYNNKDDIDNMLDQILNNGIQNGYIEPFDISFTKLDFTNTTFFDSWYSMLCAAIKEKLKKNSDVEFFYDAVKKYSLECDIESLHESFSPLKKLVGPQLKFPDGDIGYHGVTISKYNTKKIAIDCSEVPIKHYTISFKILENESIWFDDDFNSYTEDCVSVEWGDWIDDNIVELKITKISEHSLGGAKIKVYIKQDSKICGIISV